MTHTPGKTPLTEQQARSLAYWWGGEYRQLTPSAAETAAWHGVLLTRLQDGTANLLQIFSLEEAREIESQRGFQEAASPDWVG
jgi:hypothetical protein